MVGGGMSGCFVSGCALDKERPASEGGPYNGKFKDKFNGII